MGKALENYRDALDRLIRDDPIRLPKGQAINKDTVALEAGRGRGSIKKSRPGFEELIADIESAEAARLESEDRRPLDDKTRLSKVKHQKERWREDYQALKVEHDACLEKLTNVMYENFMLKKKLEELGHTNVAEFSKY